MLHLHRTLALSLAIVLGTLAGPGAALAGCNSSSCTERIEMLYVRRDTSTFPILVKLNGGQAPSGCTLLSGVYWQLDPDSEAMYDLLLAAYLSGKAVKLREDPAQSTCTVAYATVSG